MDPIDDCATLKLSRAARGFMGHPSPRVVVPAAAAAWLGRAGLGRWSWWDLAIPAIIVALEPFTEWGVHVFVLHFRPRRILGRTIDPLVARKHRAHHRDPGRPDLIFIPLPVLFVSLPVAALLAWALIHSARPALTTVAAAYTMLLVYEWTHFLIHSPYRPRSRLYRYVRRAHWLHHYRNENYWFGVTLHLADHVLGTFPARDAVRRSPTARNLGGEEAA